MLLKDILSQNVEFQQFIEEVQDDKSAKHRHKDMQRPETKVDLLSLSIEDKLPRRKSADPTEDLVEIKNELTEIDIKELDIAVGSYVIWCEWTRQTWYAHDEKCLNMNFIYRDDLSIQQINSSTELWEFYKNKGATASAGMISAKTCYILDNPPNESYEVYFDSTMPSLKYGKATPNGMFIHKYTNRFYRDMAILELDDLYSNQSSKKAGAVVSKPYDIDEAIIVSDGAWMKESCSSGYFYLDNSVLIQQTIGHLPTEVDQAVLISEIVAATEALKQCYYHKKHKIKYYYDNTSILNVFRNRKTEYINEIKEYKDFCAKLDREGFQIEFIELHPKTGEDRANDNKALMFFHNRVDYSCREMADMFTKDYRSFATDQKRDGQTYTTVKNELMPKSKNNSGGFKQNAHGGNNKYGRKF